MGIRINVVDSVAPLSRGVKDRRREQEDQPKEAPQDEVSLSHPGDRRTLKLLLQILADSLGHRGISDDVRNMDLPNDVEQVAAVVLNQINNALVSPFLQFTPNANPEDFDQFVARIEERLAGGRREARSVFRSLETASETHLGFVDEVGRILENALESLKAQGRLELTAPIV